MKFIIKKNLVASDEELLNDLILVKSQLKKDNLSMKEYDCNGAYSSSTITRRFGSWNRALEKLSITPNNRFYSEEDFMENLKNVWLRLGKQPSRRNMDDRNISFISSNAYLRKYGTWYNALDYFVRYIESTQDEIGLINVVDKNGIKHTTKREPNDRLKVKVLMRDGNRCQICGVICDGGLYKIHFDHIKPWSKGGETVLANLRVLCDKCNVALGNSNEE